MDALLRVAATYEIKETHRRTHIILCNVHPMNVLQQLYSSLDNYYT